MEHPREYRYSLDHCWVHVVGESARVGVCPHAIGNGELTRVTLPALGALLRTRDRVATFVCEGVTIEVRSPVAGSVVLVNERLLEQPDLVGDDPFNAGWLFEVQLAYDETLENVMDVDSYLQDIT